MKVYLQMFKFSYNMIPKISISLLIMMSSVTIYKLFYLGADISLFSKNNITIAQIIFMELFMLSLIVAYLRTFIIISPYFSVSFLQMIPEIRKKALIFAGFNLGFVLIWSVFILGYSNLHALFSFTISSLWLFSTMITMSSFRVPIYRSNKFWKLKLIFALLSFVVPLLSTKEPDKHPTIYITVISLFLIVVLYQIFTFVRNYMYIRLREDFNTKGLGMKMNSLQNIIDRIFVWKLNKTIRKLKMKAVCDRYEKLIHFSLFGNEFIFPWILIGSTLGLAYVNSVFDFSPKFLFISAVLYIFSFSAINTPRIFMQKYKIIFLYQKTGLRRIDFELLIFKTAIKVYFVRMMKIIIPIFTIVLINNLFFGTSDFILLILIILTISIIQIPYLFYFWRKMLKSKDYDTIKQARVMNT